MASSKRWLLSMLGSTVPRTCLALFVPPHLRPSQVVGAMTAQAFSNKSRLFVSTTRLLASSSSSFQPSSPPGTSGTPVFPNIALTKKSHEESMKRNQDEQAVFVVTGASRGIGLQCVKSLVDRTKGTVVACCRSPEAAAQLHESLESLDILDKNRVHALALDVEVQSSIEEAASEIRERFGRVDLLMNVAGLLGDAKTTPGPERSLQKIERSWLEQSMAVNLIGPVMLSKELAPLMMQRRPKKTEATSQRAVAVVANLSARVGSISDNGLGGWYSYRMSKSALNQATRTMALELKRSKTWCIALHPGTTDTDLSKPFQGNVKEGKLFPVEFTVQQLLDVIDCMEEEHSGGLYDWTGAAISF